MPDGLAAHPRFDASHRTFYAVPRVGGTLRMSPGQVVRWSGNPARRPGQGQVCIQDARRGLRRATDRKEGRAADHDRRDREKSGPRDPPRHGICRADPHRRGSHRPTGRAMGCQRTRQNNDRVGVVAQKRGAGTSQAGATGARRWFTTLASGRRTLPGTRLPYSLGAPPWHTAGSELTPEAGAHGGRPEGSPSVCPAAPAAPPPDPVGPDADRLGSNGSERLRRPVAPMRRPGLRIRPCPRLRGRFLP